MFVLLMGLFRLKKKDKSKHQKRSRGFEYGFSFLIAVLVSCFVFLPEWVTGDDRTFNTIFSHSGFSKEMVVAQLSREDLQSVSTVLSKTPSSDSPTSKKKEGIPSPSLDIKNIPASKEPNFDTYVSVDQYIVDQNGDSGVPISNVGIEIKFSNGVVISLPENGKFWPIGNGQVQEIKKVYKIPRTLIVNDSFKFQIQMIRKGSEMLPCKFEVTQLSEFNRSYTCHTDVAWQIAQKISPERLDKEGIQIRVFTDKNTPSKDIPKDAIALK